MHHWPSPYQWPFICLCPLYLLFSVFLLLIVKCFIFQLWIICHPMPCTYIVPACACLFRSWCCLQGWVQFSLWANLGCAAGTCRKEPQIIGPKLVRAFGDTVRNSLTAHSWWHSVWKVFGKLKQLLGLHVIAPTVITNPECEGGSRCKEAFPERWHLRSSNSQATAHFTFRKPENFRGESKCHLSFPKFCDNLSEQSETKCNCMGHSQPHHVSYVKVGA